MSGFSRKSFSNLAALAQGDFGGSMSELQGGGPLSHTAAALLKGSRTSMDDMDGRKTSRWVSTAPVRAARHEPDTDYPCHSEPHCPSTACRLIFVTNHLPLKVSRDEVSGWSFEWDPDALVLQAKEGLPDMDAVYVGCLPVEIEGREQEVRLAVLRGAGQLDA